MVNKVISSVILGSSFAVMSMVGSNPNSLLFLFISPNKWISTFRLALALAAFFVSFKSLSRAFGSYPKLRKSMLIAGVSLIVFGLVSTLESSLGTFFYDYFKPLDLMIILEAGIVATYSALATVPSMRSAMPKTGVRKAVPQLQHKTA